MSTVYSVLLKKVVEEFKLNVFNKAENFDEIKIFSEDINRPGLQLVGFYDYFDNTRIQIIGKAENAYIEELDSAQKRRAFKLFFSQKVPVLIYARGIKPTDECLEMAKKYDTTVLGSPMRTSLLVSSFGAYLRDVLAPSITRHGVLVDIYGEGVLITGESGVGKSETAIELVKRGHRLIADDAVEIRKTGDDMLIGTAPELIRHYMELRGIGVVDIRRLFGTGAVREVSPINLIVNIELWQEDKNYDRLGIENQYTNIFGVDIPTITVPVKPGRNLAVILEVAAMNNRDKSMGYNSAQEFTEQINRHFEQALK